MTKDINSGDTQDTNSGETATYRDTVDNQGTYDNAGTVDLQDTQEFAQSAAVSATGWSIEITHPVSGRVIRPDAINPGQVQFIPGPNTMPRIRMPVRRAPDWLDSGFDNNPAMDVHLDGEQLPIDELVDVEQEEGQTILVGEGGSELRTTVKEEYEAEERPTAATDLVSANTSYDVVDNTDTLAAETTEVQSPSGESELSQFISVSSVVPPVQLINGGIKPYQTCWTVEGENPSSTNILTNNDPDFSDGSAILYLDSGDFAKWTFTPDYDIPAGEFRIFYRNSGATGVGDIQWSVNGTAVETTNNQLLLTWNTVNADELGVLEAGNQVTVRAEMVTASTGNRQIDVVAPADNRFSYTLDNDNGGSSGFLDGPELYPATTDLEFDAYESAFSIVGGSATVTINDTTNNQALALSNDRGQTYPISASNSATVSGSFGSPGATLNLKATLSRYSPSGAQNATPRFGYDAQRLDAYDLDAERVTESLLIDESFDNSLASILNQILGNQYGWTISIEGGTTTFTVDEPGSTTASRDPDISESKIQKRVQTYAAVTIKGSTIPVSGEQFTSSTSFENLIEDDILTGSEAVYDASGTQFTRGVDYAMDYQSGQIRALTGGDLTTENTFSIDYRHQIQATHTVTGATGDTLTRTIPGVVSDRQAEQIAYVLAEVEPNLSEPRFEGSIVVPRLDVTFDPLEGLELANLDLPDVATPLSIRGEPQLTPLGLNLRLGSEPRLEEALSNIREQVSRVSDRS